MPALRIQIQMFMEMYNCIKFRICVNLREVFKVAPYSFMTARALMMRASVICVRSHDNVGFS